MALEARGAFDVTLEPHPMHEDAPSPPLGRLAIAKQYQGDLEAESVGEMLSAVTEIKGSRAYVAFEKVTGTLLGRIGSFILQHTGVVTRGAPRLSVRVVPDSGTDDLRGLTGSMTIDVVEGTHYYSMEFSLPTGEP